MDEERKEKIGITILTTLGILFLPITLPIMWASDKIRFRDKIKFVDAVEAFWIYVLVCAFWVGIMYIVWKIIEACMISPFIVVSVAMLVAFILFVFVGIPYFFYLGINGIINYKNKKSEKVLDKTEEN